MPWTWQKVAGVALLVATGLALAFFVGSCARRDMATHAECQSLGYVRGYYAPGAGIALCVPSPVPLDRAREETPR